MKMKFTRILLLATAFVGVSTYAAEGKHLKKAGMASPVVTKEQSVSLGKLEQPVTQPKASQKSLHVSASPFIKLSRRSVDKVKRTEAEAAAKKNKSGRAAQPQVSEKLGDFSVFDSWVTLDSDADGDGYYSQFTLSFDVDTVFSVADVYADIYISENGGAWYLLHTTDVFTIHGNEEDPWQVGFTLNSDYPSDSYDLLIDVYEAGYSGIVVTASPDTDNDLFDLPLEDNEHELFADPVDISFVSTDLFSDADGDGFYTQLTLEYDIDSSLAGDMVYAELVITSTSDGSRQIINTEDFVLDSHTEILDLVFDTGYLADWYDLQINLVNSATGETFGSAGAEFTALRDLPVESKNNDGYFDDPNAVDVVVVESGGGSLSWFLLPLLLVLYRQHSRWNRC